MKKIKITILLFFVCISVHAQEETKTIEGVKKTNFFTTGSLSYNFIKGDDDAYNVFYISSKTGYCISDKVALGIKIAYSRASFILKNTGANESFIVGFLRREYFNISRKTLLFQEGFVDYSNNILHTETGQLVSAFNIGSSLGVNYFLTYHLAFEGYFGLAKFSVISPKHDGSEILTQLNFNIGLEKIKLGLLYKF